MNPFVIRDIIGRRQKLMWSEEEEVGPNPLKLHPIDVYIVVMQENIL